MREIEASEEPLKNIFSDQYTFHIPRYQRPYAWEREHAEQLLEDLLVAAGEEAGSVAEMPPYFLGSIVLIRQDDNKSDVDVVDGQQRLTTLTLLLAVLRARLPDFAEDIDTRLKQKGDKLLGVPDRFRLTVRERDRQFYAEHVLAAGGLDKDVDMAQITESQRNLWSNAHALRDQLAKLEDDRVERLAQYTLSRCYLVVVTTADFGSAYRIFSVLNDRGMELQATDILKSDLIGALPEAERDLYTKKWEQTEEELGRDGFLDLMAHIRMIHRKTKLRASVLDELKKYVVSALPPKDFIDHEVVPYAEAMAVLEDANHESATRAEEINGLLRALQLIDNFDWYPCALRYYRAHKADPDRLVRFFTDLERLAASMMVRRVYINGRIDRYGELLASIERGDDLYDKGSPLQLTDEERSQTRQALDADIYLVTRIRRPVLLRLNDFLDEGIAKYEHSYITVEHVLPQTPAKEWLEDFPDQEERWGLVHRLGNLCLLSRRKNSKANNRPFTEKKKGYFAKGGSAFVLTLDVIQEEEWTPQVIRDRQERLLKVLVDGWRLGKDDG